MSSMPRRFDAQRVTAGMLVIVQAIGIALACGDFLVPGILTLLGAGAALFRFRLNYTASRFWGVSVLAIAFVLRHVLFPIDTEPREEFVLTALFASVAEFFVSLQVAILLIERGDEPLPTWFPALGIAALFCAGDFSATLEKRAVFQIVSIVFVILASAYFTLSRISMPTVTVTGRALRRAVIGITLLATVGIGLAVSTVLFRYETQIDEWVMSFYQPESVPMAPGYTGRARLGSIAAHKQTRQDEIALRIVSDKSPGYVRGRAFDTLADSNWSTAARGERRDPLPQRPANLPAAPAGQNLFEVTPSRGPERRLECWPAINAFGTIFTPSGAAHLAVATPQITVDVHAAVEAGSLIPGDPYSLYVSDERFPGVPMPELRADLLALPDNLSPEIRQLATQVTGTVTTAREKMSAVEAFFHDNFQYKIGIAIPPDVDPLTYFLEHRVPAHCEYFASGAAVLLRAAGVPCRYVTGFVCAERNLYGDYWIARNRDAHAWVEAWDDNAGWVIVDATPSVGVPAERSVNDARSAWEGLRTRWQMLRTRIRQGGVQAVAALLGAMLSFRFVQIALACAIVAGGIVWWRRFHATQTARPQSPPDPRLAELHRLLRMIDRRLRGRDFVRRPSETLHQFAQRIESSNGDSTLLDAANWYQEYAEIRYDHAFSPLSLDRLRARLRRASVRRSDDVGVSE